MYVCLTMRADHTFQGTVAGFQKTCIETHTGFKGFLRMCVWLCLQTMHYKALWQGFKKRVLRHIQDLRAFCVCVSGSAYRPCIIRHCGRVSKNVYWDTYRIWGVFAYVCVKAGQGSTMAIQPSGMPSGMPSVMHTAGHSHKMRKICSDAQLINDGGGVNMYIVPIKNEVD